MVVRLSRRVFLRRSAGVCASFLLSHPAAAVIFPGGQTAVITNAGGDSVRLRSTPSKSGDTKGNLGEGAVVLITDGPRNIDGVAWYQVQYNGQSGWVMANYIGARKLANYAAVTFTDGQGVRLRDNTDTNAKIVGMVPEGAIVQIVEESRMSSDGTPWYHINHAGHHGYVVGTYLVPSDVPPDTTVTKNTDAPTSKAPDVHKDDRVKIINTDNAGVRMRDDATYSAEIVAILEEGTVVTVTGDAVADTKGNEWIPVAYDSTKGYVVGPYLVKTTDAGTRQKSLPAPISSIVSTNVSGSTDTTPQSAPATATSTGGKIVAMAMKYIGSPYVWAGASPKGFDCSGFVMYVMQQAVGLNITHSIGSQAGSGQFVSKDNLQPGDLIYFAGTYTAGLSHAGIYIGGGRFIHAENESTGVVISNLSGGYYGPKYYTARRIS